MLTRIRKVLSQALAGYLIMVSLFFFSLGAVKVQACHDTLHSWTAIERIIEAATNPPSQAGHPLSAQQQTALAAYRHSLSEANGPRPSCFPF